ncbi:MAG TPA: glycosyltransferase family 2 protein [Candidatus Nanoarchaeia archaeon]|nr:glycosyltransferase family 2 protein [Candidatus Nanoarchaeia archaeon]
MEVMDRIPIKSLKMKQPEFSVVVPIYNEEGNIEKLDKEIRDVISKLGSYEIIYVNDGSKDNSLNNLKKLKNAVIINLNRNYGQATALDAGFKASQGDIVISLDADLQNDPKDIPAMLKKLKDDDLDVVCGWRKHRKDKSGIKILTKIGRLLRKVLIRDNVHDTGCTLRVYRKEAVKSLDIGGEMHRYIISLLRWKGFRVDELVVNHRPRFAGTTKYGYSKAVRGFIDLIYIWFIQKYYQRPLHIFGQLSLISLFLGVIMEIIMFYQRIFQNVDLSDNAFFSLGFFLILMGVIFFSFGITIDLLLKQQLNNSPYEKRYYIRDVIYS